MKKMFVALTIVGTLFVPAIVRAQFAGSVVSYNPGTGSQPGFNDPTTALGAPSQSDARRFSAGRLIHSIRRF